MPVLSPTFLRSAYVIVPKILTAVILILGMSAVVTTIWLVVHSYSPVLFGDQWDIIQNLIKSHSHLSFTYLWAQHNEHRIVTGRLFGFADLRFFGGRNITLLAEIFAIQLCHVVLLLFIVGRFASLPPKAYLTLAGFVIYCLFSPIQIENFIWGFQTVFVLTSFAATAACFAAFYHTVRAANAERRKKSGFLFVALVAAFVAEVSEAHGLVTWVVLLFLAFAFRFSRRDKVVVSVAAVVAIAIYFIGYRPADPPQTILDAVRQPGKIAHFVVTYLGRSWDSHLPNTSAWPAVSESLTTLAVLAAFFFAGRCVWNPSRFSSLQIALLGNLLFALGTALMTALGRLRLGGLEGATAIRYQTPALVFWASLAILVATCISWNRKRRLLVAQATLLILMLSAGGRWADMGRVAEARQAVEEIGWNAIAEGRFDDPAVRDIYYQPGEMKPFVRYLRDHGWGPAGEITSFARLQNVSQPLRIDGFELQPQACSGHWDRALRSGLMSVSVAGWSFTQSPGQIARRVAFASGEGKIIGYAALSTVREDVSERYPEIRKLTTGWQTNLTVPGDGVYHAFLVFGDGHRVCPVDGELRIRHFPVF